MKNKYEKVGNDVYVYVLQRNGNIVRVVLDEEGFNKVISNKYSLSTKWDDKRKVHRVITKVVLNGKARNEYLYRFLLDAPKDLVVDHINHDTLDNRYKNIRLITNSQNLQNRKGADCDSKSGHRNVWWSEKENKWVVSFRHNKKHICCGYYFDLNEAVVIAEAKRKEILPYAN